MKKIIGLTGGIGCGKTTVLKEFEKLGVPCYIMDDEAKKLYDDPEVIAEVAKAFDGYGIWENDNKINKKALGDIVFTRKEKLDELNAIIHPRVRKRYFDWLDSLKSNCPYSIVESAILYETGFNGFVDEVIVVYLEESERIKRLIERDHTDIHHIRQRMIHQMPAEQKLAMADYIVLNYEGNPREKQVQIIDRNIRRTI